MTSPLNIYEQILLEEDNSLNFMTLDAKLSKIANEKPSLLLRIIKLLVKLDYHIIAAGFFGIGLMSPDISKPLHMLAFLGIILSTSILRHKAPDMLIHLLKKWVTKIIESRKELSEQDKKELEEIASYLKDLKIIWVRAPDKQIYTNGIESALSLLAGLGIGAAIS